MTKFTKIRLVSQIIIILGFFITFLWLYFQTLEIYDEINWSGSDKYVDISKDGSREYHLKIPHHYPYTYEMSFYIPALWTVENLSERRRITQSLDFQVKVTLKQHDKIIFEDSITPDKFSCCQGKYYDEYKRFYNYQNIKKENWDYFDLFLQIVKPEIIEKFSTLQVHTETHIDSKFSPASLLWKYKQMLFIIGGMLVLTILEMMIRIILRK